MRMIHATRKQDQARYMAKGVQMHAIPSINPSTMVRGMPPRFPAAS